MLLTWLLTLAAQAPPGNVIYVDDSATGVNDGTSWTDAFTDLMLALAVAVPPQQVWVAEGRYKPTEDLNRTLSFTAGTQVFGGFAGFEARLEERAGLFDQTILTGDLLGDDGPGFANVIDNSLQVVRMQTPVSGDPVALDGFTVRGGNADGTYGGGVLAVGVQRFELRNCRLVENRADGGGGLFVLFANARVSDCIFLGNESLWNGGGANIDIASVAILERCWFLGNHAELDGGGGAYALSTTVFLDCVFSGNSTHGFDGGGGLFAPSPPRVYRCTFSANSAVGSKLGAGGLLCASLSTCADVHVLDTILWGNVDDSGSGQDAQVRAFSSGGPPVLVACSVRGWVGLACAQRVSEVDPMFVDPLGPDGVAGTLDDVLELGARSGCIDSGRAFRTFPRGFFDVTAEPFDAAHRPRFVDLLQPGDGHVLDLGALERQLNSR